MREILLLCLIVLFQVISVMSQDCEDKSSLCRYFRKRCNRKKYEKFLSTSCQDTCDKFCLPKAGCQDLDRLCPYFKNFCNKRSWRTYLRRNCQKTCPRFCDSVSAEWLDWSAYSSCGATCGGGEQMRTRECNTGNDEDCEGSASETRECNTEACPPEWLDWSEYGSCNATCGGGQQMRTRECNTGNNEDCEGSASETRECNTEACPEWLDWSEYGDCNATCGGGQQMRTRECNTGNEEDCEGSASETRECNTEACPPEWLDWSEYGSCNATCGGGQQMRTRECNTGNDEDCEGSASETRDCNTEACPEWLDWSEYGDCNATCGGGQQMRTRECNTGNDEDCEGSASETRECNTEACPPEWLDWSEYGSCNATCGGGQQMRTRECNTGNEEDCEGSASETRECNTEACPEWLDWSEYGDCNATCGGGQQMRTRECNTGNEEDCEGSASETRECNTEACPPEWLDWSEYGSCNATCGGGQQMRTRECNTGNEEDCEGSASETRECNTEACPEWLDWSEYGDCNATCGGGQQMRTRECNTGNEEDCEGSASETRECNTEACPPEWLDWSEYGSCNATCGGGQQMRTRECNTGNDEDCEGSASETRDCNTEACPGTSDDCSVPCGGGTYTQTIPCDETTDPNCVDEESETFYCNLEACEPEDGTRWSSWSDCEPACGPGTQTKTRGDVTISRACIVSTCPVQDGSYECTKVCGGGTRYDGNNYFDCNTEACQAETCPQQYGYQPRDEVNSHECCDNSNTLSITCGIQASNARIVGGQDVAINVWPWMVSLLITDGRGQTFGCGGALLNERHVLTAAHCLVVDNGVEDDGVLLTFGTKEFRGQDGQSIISERFYIHEDYDEPRNDIAIVRLSSPVSMGDSIRPLCLPQGEKIKDDMQCYVAGWGLTSENGASSDILQEVAVRILPGAMCEEVFGSTNGNPAKIVCAGRVSGGIDSCQGDSGGPLMCQRCASCGYFVAGVVSFGFGCARPNSPGAYVRVSYFEDWIYEQMGEVADRPSFQSC